jgi:hypothetical protein
MVCEKKFHYSSEIIFICVEMNGYRLLKNHPVKEKNRPHFYVNRFISG